ncbi:glycosyltransferase, partial [Novosphingobium sp. FGD1]
KRADLRPRRPSRSRSRRAADHHVCGAGLSAVPKNRLRQRAAKVYLYDSLEHWADVGASEGFGLPPLEAMANGCTVFSSVNDALADYLDPGFNSRKIRVHSLGWDRTEILRTVHRGGPPPPERSWFESYSPAQVSARLECVMDDATRFFEFTNGSEPDIEDPWERRRPTRLQRARRAVKMLAGV